MQVEATVVVEVHHHVGADEVAVQVVGVPQLELAGERAGVDGEITVAPEDDGAAIGHERECAARRARVRGVVDLYGATAGDEHAHGVEGSLIYALSAPLRDCIEATGSASVAP